MMSALKNTVDFLRAPIDQHFQTHPILHAHHEQVRLLALLSVGVGWAKRSVPNNIN